MTRFLLPAILIAVFSALADAGVRPGDRFVNRSGNIVTFQGWTNPQANQTQTYVQDEFGDSSTASGTPTPGGCSGETDAGGTMTSADDAPGSDDANRYQVSNGKLQQQKPNGSWQTLRKSRGIQPTSAPGGGDECSGDAPNPIIPPPGTLPTGDTIGSHPGRTQ